MTHTLNIPEGKKVYFASDAHFGLELERTPMETQKLFCSWLDAIKPNCGALFLVGDMFDYWFEYRTVVPKGYVRFLGKLAEFSDAGIPIFIFYGNHDMWMTDYLQQECGCTIVPDAWEGLIFGRKFHIEHGDASGDPSKAFWLMRKFFRCKVAQWCFRWIHPDLTMWFGYLWSHSNRVRRAGKKVARPKTYKAFDPEKEPQVVWAKKHLEQHPDVDYYVFGHRHVKELVDLQGETTEAKLAILGEWIWNSTYGVFDGKEFKLLSW